MSHVRQALCDHKKVLLARTTEPWLCVCSIHNILVLAPPTASYNFAAPVDARFFSGTHSLPPVCCGDILDRLLSGSLAQLPTQPSIESSAYSL